MGSDASRPKLWYDERSVADDLLQANHLDASYQFGGRKGPLAGCTPDIDPFGVEY